MGKRKGGKKQGENTTVGKPLPKMLRTKTVETKTRTVQKKSTTYLKPKTPFLEHGEKRNITYTIQKNRGLTAHRKKEDRNPRVKLKNKFSKAKKRRKGQVREVHEEQQYSTYSYGGEVHGINRNVVRSVTLS